MSSLTRIGIDTGGTFTDFVCLEHGAGRVHKAPSTPQDPLKAIVTGLAELRPEGLEGVEVVHGTTVGTNAFLTRQGARVVLVTTQGFEDVLFIGRQTRRELFSLAVDKTPELLPRERVLGVKERLGPDGRILTPLSAAEIARVRRRLKALAPEAVAVCLLDAYAHPEHEERLAAALAGFRRDFSRTLLLKGPPLTWLRLQEEFASLRRYGLAELAADGLDPDHLAAAAELELRYPGQSHTLAVPLMPVFREEFHDRHRRLYGHAFPDREVEVAALRLNLTLPGPDTGLPVLAPVVHRHLKLPRAGTVWLDQGPATVPLYYRPALPGGFAFAGSALVLEDHATLLVLDGFQGEVLGKGHILLRW